jgi:tetratricopeptide (TPR) repeat protein
MFRLIFPLLVIAAAIWSINYYSFPNDLRSHVSSLNPLTYKAEKFNTQASTESPQLRSITPEPIAFSPPLPILPSTPPKVTVNQPSGYKLLPSQKYVYQTFNNCGPAALSMVLDFFGISKSQLEIADRLRPFQHSRGIGDDKSVMLDELASFARENNLITFKRPNGDIEKLKLFLENGIPVLTLTWLNEQGGFGHYLIVKGYEDKVSQVISDDSIYGANRYTSYEDFLKGWQVFNYEYLVIAPQEKSEIIKKILGPENDINISYQKSLERADDDLKQNPTNHYAHFNKSTGFYYLNQFDQSIQLFEQIQNNLPQKILWYQIEPILSYTKVKNYDKAIILIDKILSNGNPAFSELYFIKGQILLEKGDKDAAKKEFEKALYYNKNFHPALNAMQNI